MKQRILFVIAALNEARNIPHVIGKVKKHFPEAAILVVDGYSSDNTVEVSIQSGASVILVSKVFGIGGAVEAGMLYASKNNYDKMIRIDADGQHEPEEVKKLLDTSNHEDIDLLIGSRFLGSADYKPNLLRSVSIGFIAWLMKVCYGVKISDCTSGCHLYSKRLFDFFSRDHSFNYSEVLVICLAHKAGFTIKEEFINMQERMEGVSTFTFKNAFFYVFTNVVNVIFTMPLRVKKSNL